jgi:hypothetical protein
MPITKRFWQMGFDATERDIVIPTAFILLHGNMSMVSMEKWCGQKSDRTIFFAKKVGDLFGYVRIISYLCSVKQLNTNSYGKDYKRVHQAGLRCHAASLLQRDTRNDKLRHSYRPQSW